MIQVCFNSRSLIFVWCVIIIMYRLKDVFVLSDECESLPVESVHESQQGEGIVVEGGSCPEEVSEPLSVAESRQW